MIPLGANQRNDSFPVAAFAIALICVAVFVWQQFLGDANIGFMFRFGFIPVLLFGDQPVPPGGDLPHAVRFVTYMFLHGNWAHIISNLLYLMVFAGPIEHEMGHPRYVIFYLLCGLFAVLAQALSEPGSMQAIIGASGGVSGILGAYMLLRPRAEIAFAVPVFIVVQIVRLPAWVVLFAWFVMQYMLDSDLAASSSDIAFRAHMGGFVAGMLLAPIFVPGLARRMLYRIGRATGRSSPHQA